MDPRSPERGQYEFVQALIREVAYNTLSKKDRKKLHLAAARYFESMGSDEMAGALASHYLAAHANASEAAEEEALATQARIALKAAAARAESLGSFGQAVTFLDQAVLVAHDSAEQASLLTQAGRDEHVSGRHVDAETRFRRAVQIAAEAGSLEAEADATAGLAHLLLTDVTTQGSEGVRGAGVAQARVCRRNAFQRSATPGSPDAVWAGRFRRGRADC